MLSIVGRTPGAGSKVSRRELMRVGALSLFSGVAWPRLLAANQPSAKRQARAKSVVLFNLLGGPSHQDMFDMKPEAPAEIRGEFQPIATSLPGLQICEHLPRTAQWMHRTCLIRTVSHNYNAHNPLPVMTGYTGGDLGQLRPLRTDPPDIGAICQYLGLGPEDMPGAFCLPCYPGFGERSMYPGIRRPGPYGGFLGSQYDPVFSHCAPTFDREPAVPYYDPVWPMGEPQLPYEDARPELTIDRISQRRALVEQFESVQRELERSPAVARMDQVKRRAYEMLTSSRTRDAFNLALESDATRDRYGRNLFGSSMLVARRLVGAGVPFISVHAENFIPYGFTYDMHENNFGMLKNYNLPIFDMCVPALLEDLDARGLLDTTLLVIMGEMGRAPTVNSKAGRDHWPQCGFCLLAGGGIQSGTVYGESDKHAAYPIDRPVTPGDIVATIYHLLGIDHHLMVPDFTGRPMPIAHGGEPLWEILATS